MKSTILIPLLGSLVQALPNDLEQLHKRQGVLGGVLGNLVNSGYGKVPQVPGAAPLRAVLEPRAGHGSKTVKIRYGPYKVPNMDHANVMGEKGVLYNYPDVKVDKPCEECVLVGMNAGLEYPDGRSANTADGLWLHHMVLMNVGAKRMDPTCVGRTSLPHMAVGTSPSNAERVFSSGNERSRVLFTPPWEPDAKMGYYLNPTDEFRFLVDLMNMNKKDEVVYMTLTYDYIEGRPEGFDNMKAIWLDVEQCGSSEVRPPVEHGKFMVDSTWTATIEGEILGAGGHLHDGGTHVTLKVDGREVCRSDATYGVSKGGMGGDPSAAVPAASNSTSDAKAGMGGTGGTTADSHSHASAAETEHIVKMSGCRGPTMPIQRLVKGQKWLLEAFYDLDAHQPMRNAKGVQEKVMGISIMYIKNPTA